MTPQSSGADAAHCISSGAIALLPALTQRCRVSTRSAAPDFHPATSTASPLASVARCGGEGPTPQEAS